jgi:hypothetical protein
MERISAEMDRWSLKIEDPDKLSRYAGESIYKELKRINSERENVKRIQRLNRMFPILDKFKLEPNLHKSQNLYFEIAKEYKSNTDSEKISEWVDYFNLLGANLGVKVE